MAFNHFLKAPFTASAPRGGHTLNQTGMALGPDESLSLSQVVDKLATLLIKHGDLPVDDGIGSWVTVVEYVEDTQECRKKSCGGPKRHRHVFQRRVEIR
jgi:hypothetical protein